MITKIKMALAATKDFFWFMREMHKTEIRTKHAFMAYSAIIFLSGSLISDFYDYSLKQDWFMTIYSYLKAIL